MSKPGSCGISYSRAHATEHWVRELGLQGTSINLDHHQDLTVSHVNERRHDADPAMHTHATGGTAHACARSRTAAGQLQLHLYCVSFTPRDEG